jgi:choline dehydrogenase-like flavoprotein
MILDGSRKTLEPDQRYDVCIIGAGVAGITLANELRSVFDQVILVEAGSREYLQEVQDTCAPETLHHMIPDPTYSRLKMLGGSSNHWQNNTSPFTPLDFQRRDWIKNSGWPISYHDLAPYYPKAAEYCGVGNDGYSTAYWLNTLNGEDVVRESNIVLTQVSKHSNPPIRFFEAYGKELVDSDHVTVLINSYLTDMTFDASAKKIVSIETKSVNGHQNKINAKAFVLCLGGLDNPRILLAMNQKYDNRIGNQGDSVGRYFMEHPTPRAAHLFTTNDLPGFYEGGHHGNRRIGVYFSLSEDALLTNYCTNLRIPLNPSTDYMMSDGISSFHILKEDLGNGSWPDNFGTHISHLISNFDDVIEAISRKSFGKELFESANEIAGFEMPMMMEQTPNRDNRITLGSIKDKFGLPRINIQWALSESDKNMVWKSLEVVAREFGALSIGRLQLLRERASRLWGDQLGFSDHHMGTTRMAEHPGLGVVDKDQRVFGTQNLYVSGSSIFATGSHVPPTLTIAAFSIRLAKILQQELKNA